MILVVNETDSAAPLVSQANRKFAAELKVRFREVWKSKAEAGLSLYQDPASQRDLLLVDRFSEGLRLPPKGGVGHARKTGADFAAYLIHQRRVHSPWIHCTDADVRLPPRYFDCTTALDDSAARETAALIYPFRHRLLSTTVDRKTTYHVQNRILQATQLYEFSLRYYVAGLGFAGSPYAHHTIGSTMAINAVHYAKVRGFPRRQAGEDFYLLNKLTKVGSVRQLSAEAECEPIDISVRLSDRVPFGTGAAVGKIIQLVDPPQEFQLYHPAVFGVLRAWLTSLPDFWAARSLDIAAVLPRSPLIQEDDGSVMNAINRRLLIAGLEHSGAGEALQHAFRQSSDLGQFERQMHTWFDAFRTLKLIHFLRDHGLPSISFQALLALRELDQMSAYEPALPEMLSEMRQAAT